VSNIHYARKGKKEEGGFSFSVKGMEGRGFPEGEILHRKKEIFYDRESIGLKYEGGREGQKQERRFLYWG